MSLSRQSHPVAIDSVSLELGRWLLEHTKFLRRQAHPSLRYFRHFYWHYELLPYYLTRVQGFRFRLPPRRGDLPTPRLSEKRSCKKRTIEASVRHLTYLILSQHSSSSFWFQCRMKDENYLIVGIFMEDCEHQMMLQCMPVLKNIMESKTYSYSVQYDRVQWIVFIHSCLAHTLPNWFLVELIRADPGTEVQKLLRPKDAVAKSNRECKRRVRKDGLLLKINFQ